jgi:hypothetical protein
MFAPQHRHSVFSVASATLLAMLLLAPAVLMAQQPAQVLPQIPAPQSNAPQPFVPAPQSFPPGPERFNFKIDPKTPTSDLLPGAPKQVTLAGSLLTDKLALVPEVEFQSRPGKQEPHEKLVEQTAHQLAKMNHLNVAKTDAFLTALLASRSDLAGLPFAMGDDCRTSGERTKQFTFAVNTVRKALALSRQFLSEEVVATEGGPLGTASPNSLPPSVIPAQSPTLPRSFWSAYQSLCQQEDAAYSRIDKEMAQHVALARIAALVQMLAPASPELRLGLVKYLAGVSRVEATQVLARMAIFSAEDEVRLAAIDALKVRREKDYSEILVRGLRYPWPAVAKRSADSIGRLERKDLIPELLTILDEADPRLPTTKGVGDKKPLVVREMVKVNHHRNCMLCHAPGNSGTVSADAITAEVPVQSQSLPTPAQGYRQSSPDLMIRVDVTYLRQDFSAMLPIADAHPWPELQRFDFLLRERTLTADEAAAYREKLTPKLDGMLSPYHQAALAALRELTGKDTAPTSASWRKLLDLPAKN